MAFQDAPVPTIRDITLLSDNWYKLHRYTFDLRRRDGRVDTLTREVYDRGNGAVVLLYHRERGTVILTRQFRIPAFVNREPTGMLIEAPAGLLDGDHPEAAIKREIEEETGFRIDHVRPILEVFMSPGSVTERVHLFFAEYTDADRVSEGGGAEHEGEDIEVFEVPLDEALKMVERKEIIDGKTVMLLYHAKIYGI